MRSNEKSGEGRRGFVLKVVRFLGWSVGVLVVALGILWQVVNWRGARAWERAQERLVEEGEAWTLEELVGEAVPDEENFMAAGVFWGLMEEGSEGVFGSDELEEVGAMLDRFDQRGACVRACRGDLVIALWVLDLIEAGDVEVLKHDQISDVTGEGGGQIGYRREGERYVVWSAGMDGEDDGGESGEVRDSPKWGGFEGGWVWRYGVLE